MLITWLIFITYENIPFDLLVNLLVNLFVGNNINCEQSQRMNNIRKDNHSQPKIYINNQSSSTALSSLKNHSTLKANKYQYPSILNSLPAHIQQSIYEIEKLSFQLLSIGDLASNANKRVNTLNNSASKSQSQLIEKNIKDKFDEIYRYTKQFYNLMNDKMHLLNKNVEQQLKKINKQKKESSQDQISRVSIENNRFQFLNDKIRNLDCSLKETKTKEAKLIDIIQKLVQKYQIKESFSFLENQRPSRYINNNNNNNNRQRSMTCMRQFPVTIPEQQEQFSSPNLVIEGKQREIRENNIIDTQSIYQGLYHSQDIGESMVIGHNFSTPQGSQQIQQPSRFRLRQLEQPQNQPQYIKKLYSKQAPIFLSTTQSKTSLRDSRASAVNQRNTIRSNKDSQSTIDDKQHRLKFMIGNLKGRNE